MPDEPYVAVKDGVDSRTTDSFVPRATLAARCPLLTEDELDEEAGKVKKKEGVELAVPVSSNSSHSTVRGFDSLASR